MTDKSKILYVYESGCEQIEPITEYNWAYGDIPTMMTILVIKKSKRVHMELQFSEEVSPAPSPSNTCHGIIISHKIQLEAVWKDLRVFDWELSGVLCWNL